MIDELTAAEYRRIARLPDQIDDAIAKVGRLLTKAESMGLRPSNWAEQWEALQSRFLTDPELIAAVWEREFDRARIISTGENDDNCKD